MLRKRKVIIVDDSALIRAVLSEIIGHDQRFSVCATAADPYEARELIKQHNPDVITLDIEMPKMNGISFLKNLMRLRPMPVLMISTLTHTGAAETLEALALGAVDYIGKPKTSSELGLDDYRHEILEKLFAAANANVAALESPPARLIDHRPAPGKIMRKGLICAIGASTGGTQAIKDVVSSLPKDSPPVVITQHIPPSFSASFAARLDKASVVKVYEAEHQQRIEPGCVYIAPGDAHLKVVKQHGRYRCELDRGPMVNRHRPSVEVLFDSVTEAAGADACGVMLTGMGADGAQAMLRMHQAGCETFAQDEATSVVWGMPGSAVRLGGVSKVLPLSKIASQILHCAYGDKQPLNPKGAGH